MEREYRSEDVLFGFEYETLIEPNEGFWKLVIDTVLNIKSGALKTCNDTFQSVKDRVANQNREMIETIFREAPDYGAIDYYSNPNYSEADSSDRGKALRETSDPTIHIVYRFVLAAIFNSMIKKYKQENLHRYVFKAQGEDGEICDTFDIDDTSVIKKVEKRNVKTSTWAVTYDGSVMRIANEPLYKRIEGRTLRKVIPYIRCVEIVSPVLKYSNVSDDFETIINTILPANNMFVYWNNHRTSNHVHLSHQGFNFRDNPFGLVRLCMAWWYIEPIIMFMMGNWRRKNKYCMPIDERLKEIFKDAELIQHAFNSINEDNVIDFVTQYMTVKLDDGTTIGKYTQDDLKTRDKIKLLYAIADLFQGDLSERSSRYAALNLLNICPGGINTVEIRIKHGSSDGKESKMFMLLLANFLSAAISKPCVTYTDEKNKKLFFEVKNILQTHRDWTKKVRLDLDDTGMVRKKNKISNREKIQEAFDIFMDWINLDEKNEVREYWQKRLGYVLRSREPSKRSSSKSDLSSPLLGGMSSQDVEFIKEMNKKKEYTSFGYINYDELHNTIEKDYKRFGWTKRWGKDRSSNPSAINSIRQKTPAPARMVMVTAGGKGKNTNKAKNEKK